MRRLIVLALVLSVLLVPAFAFATIDLEKVRGYLPNTDMEESFTVDCSEDSQSFEFTWPDYSDFWVRVLGMHGDNLGDFQLSEGGIIELTGSGRFTLVVYSKDGRGAWSVVPVED